MRIWYALTVPSSIKTSTVLSVQQCRSHGVEASIFSTRLPSLNAQLVHAWLSGMAGVSSLRLQTQCPTVR